MIVAPPAASTFDRNGVRHRAAPHADVSRRQGSIPEGTMRRFAKWQGWALAALMALALPGSAAAEGLSKDTIKIGVGVDPAFSALYYAKQAKLFEQAGLNVELLQFTQGGDAVDA